MWTDNDTAKIKKLLSIATDIDINQLKMTDGKVKRPSYGISAIKAYDEINDVYYSIDYVNYEKFEIQYIRENYHESLNTDISEDNYYSANSNKVKTLNNKLICLQINLVIDNSNKQKGTG